MKLEILNTSKSYGNIQALKNISVAFESGELIGFLGRNGAGKSTLIKCIVGILNPDSGKILFDGKKLSHSEIKIGYLPEERGLYLNSTVNDQLKYFAALNNMNRNEAAKAIDDYLDIFQIKDLKKRKVKTLSKGNKQKIQFIAAILHDPDLIILDEPFSGLDPVNSMVFKNVIQQFKKKGKIIIFSSHQMEGVQELCDRILMIKNGSIVIEGALSKIIEERSKSNVVHLKTNNKDKTEEVLHDIQCQYSYNDDYFIIQYANKEELKKIQRTLIQNELLILLFEFEQTNVQEIFLEELS